MKPEIVGLLALGALNIVLGTLIAFVCYRVSSLNKLIADAEKRISRLEILTSLADPKRAAKGQG
ncbi:MAG TPA: hypothetical protein VHP35_08095 [Terriglobia bacterium]|jgi:hypothetical protein|nr:hypothetical protein [Terriglobia bacterium]